MDTAKIEQLTGLKGTLNVKENVFKVSYPRNDLHVLVGGVTLTPPMGLTAWAAFVGTDQEASVDGDFATYASEVQNVLKALRKADIDIVAIHNHMIGEDPREIFLHFWGEGSTEVLAQGLKAALDTQKK